MVSLKPLYCSTGRIRSHTNRDKISPKIFSGLNNSCSEIFMSNRSMKLVNQENEIKNLKKHIDNLNLENKTIRAQNYLHQKDVDSIQNQELNMSNLFKQHESDVHNLKEQVRKIKASLSKEQKLRTEREMEAFELRTALYKKDDVITENKLLEKFDVKKLLDNTQETLESKQIELETVKRQLENQEKNYKIELANIQKLTKQSNDRCEELESRVAFLQVSLREKQRQIDIQNIYSNRINLGKINSKPEGQTKHYSECCRSRQDPPKSLESEHLSKQMKDDTNQTKSNKSEDNRDRFKMIEDIRNILLDEIRLGKFTVINNHIYYNSEYRTLTPTVTLSTDVQIKSPFINDDKVQPCRRFTTIHRESDIPLLIKPCLMPEKQNSTDNIENKKPKSVVFQNESSIAKNNLNSKSFEHKIDNKVPDIIEPICESIYQHPDNNAVVENENWLKEIEMISAVDNTVSESKIKSSKRTDIGNVMNNSCISYNPVKTMFKLSPPIMEDLKEKKAVIEDELKNCTTNTNLVDSCDSTVHRVTNGNLRNSFHSYIYSKLPNKVDRKVGQLGL